MGEAGFFALFFGSAAVAVSVCFLKGWQMWLKSHHPPPDHRVLEAVEDLRREIHDFTLQQDERMEDLQSRLDFAERMLANPHPASPILPKADKEPTPV